MENNNLNNIDYLKEIGFKGFKKISYLNDNFDVIPEQIGIYIVIYDSNNAPEFLINGVGGFFKGKDPNISISELRSNWVDKAKVVYIGKAGTLTGKATLRSRLKQYLKFGQGKNIGHYGGRLIWQLKNHLDLKICWLTFNEIEPRELEKKLIDIFEYQNEKRPFANLAR